MRGGRFLSICFTALVGVAIAGCTSPGPPPSNDRYVALGDSYTSGPLIPIQIVGADTPAGCLQSTSNYPHDVSAHLARSFFDASCIGATTDDMTNPQRVSFGENAPQFDRLTAQTQVVTLGIGGNDIGFADIAVNCAEGGLTDPDGTPCQDQYVVNGDDTIGDAIDALAPKLGAVLDGIHSRAPAAKVFVVGYPAILPDAGDGCYPTMPITAGDVPYLRAKEQQLNATIQSITGTHGDIYVDTYTPSIGHDACSGIGTRWVEPVVPVALAAPVHPNSDGEHGMADAVLAALDANGIPTL